MNVVAILHATLSGIQPGNIAHRFYEGVLGLMADPARPELGFPGVWYAVGANQQIHLMQQPDPRAGLQRSSHGGRDRHAALAVDDLAELARRLESAGIAHTRSRSGRAALFCRDPDGNALEFVGVES